MQQPRSALQCRDASRVSDAPRGGVKGWIRGRPRVRPRAENALVASVNRVFLLGVVATPPAERGSAVEFLLGVPEDYWRGGLDPGRMCNDQFPSTVPPNPFALSENVMLVHGTVSESVVNVSCPLLK